MGLDISPGVFSGSYVAFNYFRQAICEAVGGSFPPHKDKSLDENMWYWGDDDAEWPGLSVLLSHSDCDGEILPSDALLVANDLIKIKDRLTVMDGRPPWSERNGWLLKTVERFIEGCLEAVKSQETLIFE